MSFRPCFSERKNQRIKKIIKNNIKFERDPQRTIFRNSYRHIKDKNKSNIFILGDKI